MGVCALALVGCSGGSGGSGSPAAVRTAAGAGTAPSGEAAALQQSFVDVIHHTLPSVVEISTDSGLGSGVVFDDDGHVVTNAHVVGNATSFHVTPANSTRRLSATLVGTYPPDDLAVIKVSGSDLRRASFADSSKVRVGDVVLAMGNPLGLSSSVTEGIVSATGRTVGEPASGGSGGATLPDSIQTSAAINPGNSGGALVDLEGKVVGIPTLAALSSAGGLTQSAAPGIGFAIPSNTATDIAGQLVRHGRVVDSHRAAIGATVVTVAGPNGEAAGVGLNEVTPNGPAAEAGLVPGDVITAVDGKATPDTETLAAVLATLRPGQRVAVTVRKDNGQSQTANVTLGELPGGS